MNTCVCVCMWLCAEQQIQQYQVIKSSETSERSKKPIGSQEQKIEREIKREVKRQTRNQSKSKSSGNSLNRWNIKRESKWDIRTRTIVFSTTIDCQVCICLQKRVITPSRNPSWGAKPSVTTARLNFGCADKNPKSRWMAVCNLCQPKINATSKPGLKLHWRESAKSFDAGTTLWLPQPVPTN